MIPLAYLLDDQLLIAKARKWVDWTLTHQSPEGWIGPPKNADWWPNMVMLKVLTQYQEATGDLRVIPLMQRYFRHHLAQGRARPLHEWASYRWADELVSVLWLFNRTGDRELLDLARLLQSQGTDWKQHFAEFPFRGKTSPEQLGLKIGVNNPDRAMRAHGVNNAMALKTSALWSVLSGDRSDREAIHRALEVLDRHQAGIHLLARLQSVATVHEQYRALHEHDGNTGGAAETRQPGQSLLTSGDVFVLLPIGARHDESGEAAARQLRA